MRPTNEAAARANTQRSAPVEPRKCPASRPRLPGVTIVRGLLSQAGFKRRPIRIAAESAASNWRRPCDRLRPAGET